MFKFFGNTTDICFHAFMGWSNSMKKKSVDQNKSLIPTNVTYMEEYVELKNQHRKKIVEKMSHSDFDC